MSGIADYEFIRSLGAGNNGEFFLAPTPKRLPIDAEFVTVKVVSGQVSDDTFRRATRELTAFASVQSPYLVTLYDAGQQGSVFYYAMEYLPAGTLEGEQTDQGIVVAAVADVARAAHALHERGIVHRDIKPQNVHLHENGAKLADLGLSQLLEPGVTVTSMGSLTSIEYTDPALVQGGAPSRASDIYSLGATLHRGLSGEGLYGELPDGDPMLTFRRVLSSSPQISTKLDPRFAAIVSWTIAPDPADRPKIALELADRLSNL